MHPYTYSSSIYHLKEILVVYDLELSWIILLQLHRRVCIDMVLVFLNIYLRLKLLGQGDAKIAIVANPGDLHGGRTLTHTNCPLAATVVQTLTYRLID